VKLNTEWSTDLDQENGAEEAAAPSPDVFREMLAERIFDADKWPAKPEPILSLGTACIGTPGNIMAVQAGIKAGKTATVGAINAAFFVGRAAGEFDTLGFTATNDQEHAVLHFDTEQSRYDHDATIRRALSRAGAERPPEWFQSFCLTDLAQGNRVYAMETAVEDAVQTFGGIHAVILDGVADFMRDPNNAEEAFALVDKLHGEAVRLNCLIIAVIHENPGGMDSGKTRGHLGSQLARKAETNLRIRKDASTAISTIWADHARSCHIPQSHGICFQWSDKMGRHVGCGRASAIKADAKHGEYRKLAEHAFGDQSAMTFTELREALREALKKDPEGKKASEETAKRRIREFKAEGIVIQDGAKKYLLNPDLGSGVKLGSNGGQ